MPWRKSARLRSWSALGPDAFWTVPKARLAAGWMPGLLRRLCLEARERIDPRGVWLRNAAVAGPLDLAGFDVPFPLRFEGCEFDSPLVVEGAHLNELSVTGCARLPGLLANGVRIRRDLDLSRSHISGTHWTSASNTHGAAVWLCESDISGRLLCAETTISADGGRAVQADRMRVAGAVRFLDRFTARRELRLLGARIGGSLDLTGVRLLAPEGIALGLADASSGAASFSGRGSRGAEAGHPWPPGYGQYSRSGQFLLRNVDLTAVPAVGGLSRFSEAGTALSAPRMTVGGEITFEQGCDVNGGIDLSMIELSSLLIDAGCSLRAAGQTALDLTNAEVLSTFTIGDGVPVEGTIRLSGARIHGNLCLRGARLSNRNAGPWSPRRRQDRRRSRIEDLEADGGALGFRAAVIGSFGRCERSVPA